MYNLCKIVSWREKDSPKRTPNGDTSIRVTYRYYIVYTAG